MVAPGCLFACSARRHLLTWGPIAGQAGLPRARLPGLAAGLAHSRMQSIDPRMSCLLASLLRCVLITYKIGQFS